MATRPYDRSARLARAEALTDDILDCVLTIVEDMDVGDVSLELASQTAGVSVPTLVRKFGSKDGMYAAAFARARTRYRAARERAQTDVDWAAFLVRAQLSIYERWGRALLYLRTRERQWPVVHAELELGRAERRRWLSEVLAVPLSGAEAPDVVLSRIFALTDVHLWAVFRLDQGFGKRRTQQAMEELLRGYLAQVGMQEASR